MFWKKLSHDAVLKKCRVQGRIPYNGGFLREGMYSPHQHARCCACTMGGLEGGMGSCNTLGEEKEAKTGCM